MTTPIVIIGAGGFGRHAHDVVDAMNASSPTYEMLGFLDDGRPDERLLHERNADLIGSVSLLEELPVDVNYVIAIGSGDVRRRIDRWATSLGRKAATLRHPSSTLGRHVALGEGSVICSHVSIGTNVKIGRHAHINFNCTVGHDAILSDYVTAYPGANIAGNVFLGESTTVGSGAVIIQGLSVGADSTIGASACVVRDLPSRVTAVGVPAKAETGRTDSHGWGAT
ncbi:acetyltransferase [Georgenia satyanarayanai]|uniref:acetyltransferase n=1 Tax=Georgenia satyanarayanai TaxID=860221 RepID=UPI0020401A31|nr:acetyltransferase [Georgenia satyanarayanai]MCM3661327.1 acetyltransferase [Georgenia satyanarayanai]